MSRLRGPRLKIMRALGVELPGLSRKSIEKRPHPPGQHGPQVRKRTNRSDYSLRLREKQKVRFNYGLSERQLRGLVEDATRLKGNTGVVLIQLLERRLDNVVFRAGFARTIPGARQMVSHGHIQVNGRTVDRPSYRLRRGDVISVATKSRALAQSCAGNRRGHAQRLDHGRQGRPEGDDDGVPGRDVPAVSTGTASDHRTLFARDVSHQRSPP